MNLSRAETVRAIAVAMPWYLDFLAVWMLEYETRRLERMLKRAMDGIAALAKYAMQPKWADAVDGINWKPGAYTQVSGAFMEAFASARAQKAAHAASQAAMLTNLQARQNMMQQQYMSTLAGLQNAQSQINQASFQQRRSMLDDAFNMFSGKL